MKRAPYIYLLSFICLLCCKQNPQETKSSPQNKPHAPAEFRGPAIKKEEKPKYKDKHSKLLDSLKVKTAAL